jgi:hypothetical protein
MPPKPNRFPVDFSFCNEQRPEAFPTDAIPHQDGKSQRFEFVEQICLTLFDRWCEQRNVIALTYLMHGWPLTRDDPSLIGRLVQSLRELVEHHHESLLNEEIALLVRLLSCG